VVPEVAESGTTPIPVTADESAAEMASIEIKEQSEDAGSAPYRLGGSRPLFTWKYRHGVDGQGRIQFPVKWKMRTTDVDLIAVIQRHRTTKKEHVMVLPMDQFDRFTARARGAAFEDPTYIALRHEWADQIMGIDLDGAGRFTLPPELRKPANLGKEALLVGCIDWFEVWNPADYEEARRDERPVLMSAGLIS